MRIWELPEQSSDTSTAIKPSEKLPLELDLRPKSQQMDIVAFDWSPDGKLLAVGGFDSIVRVWTSKGDEYMIKCHHKVNRINYVFAAVISNLRRWVRREASLASGFQHPESGY